MATLENSVKTVSISLQIYGKRKNIVSNELEYLCSLTINTTLFNLLVKKHELCYISQAQINYIQDYLDNFNYDFFDDEAEIFDFYPITMFLVMDFFKQSSDSVYVNLKAPIELFDSKMQGEYKIGLDFEISLFNFIDFFKQLIEETK